MFRLQTVVIAVVVSFLVSAVVGSASVTPVPVATMTQVKMSSPTMAQYNVLKSRIAYLMKTVRCVEGRKIGITVQTDTTGTEYLLQAEDGDPTTWVPAFDPKCVT